MASSPEYRPMCPRPTGTLSMTPLIAREILPIRAEQVVTTLTGADTPLHPALCKTSSVPGYVLAEQLIPSARPRASPTATTRQIRPPHPATPCQDSHGQSKEQRANAIEDLWAKMVAQLQRLMGQPSWVGHPSLEPQMFNHIIRLRPSNAPEQNAVSQTHVCLLFTHANGFPKELWFPVIRRLIERGLPIDEIILWEQVNHGTSAVVNRNALGDTYDWVDNTRDILQFLKYYYSGSTRRFLIGVGQSVGGNSLTRAALQEPSLFSALILIDPIIFPEFTGSRSESGERLYNWTIMSLLARRSVWRDRADAKRMFLRSPFFCSWDPEVLDLYVKHALIEHPSGEGVMLKQSPYDEAAAFADPVSSAEVYNLLPTLPQSVALKWITSGKDSSMMGGEEMRSHTIWQRPENCQNVRISEAGHLIPFERPDITADEIASFICERYGCTSDSPEWIKARF